LDEAAAGLRLAWALELLVDEGLDEPLEIGWPQAEAVIHALPELTAHAYEASMLCCMRQGGLVTTQPPESLA
jgi:hypothetical protein